MIRKHGELEEMPYQVLTDDILKDLLFELLSDDQKNSFIKKRDLDFAYEIS